ncbi:MAG: N-acetyltransferase [Sphaerospermopsis sp.]|nr:N-acetyltransferase [Sphaerospermopsis sp.]
MEIRAEQPSDFPGIRQVNIAAFGRVNEADLVDILRQATTTLSLVAVQNMQIIGHICFSIVSIDTDNPVNFNVFGLAPLAVMPSYQRQGIGSKLVRQGLAECSRLGCDAVVVLGHPEYYPRFGFIPAKEKGLVSEYPVPDEVFMVLQIKNGILRNCSGKVRYRKEFGNV